MTMVDRSVTRKRQREQDSRATKRSNTIDDEVFLQENILSTNFATTVYIKGETYNTTRALRSKAKAYISELREVAETSIDEKNLKLTGYCVRITNLSNEAKAKLLRMQLLCGKPVTVTEPWANNIELYLKTSPIHELN